MGKLRPSRRRGRHGEHRAARPTTSHWPGFLSGLFSFPSRCVALAVFLALSSAASGHTSVPAAEVLELGGVWRNPALLPTVDKRSGFLGNLSGSSYLNDREELLDNLLETRDEAFRLEEKARRFEFLPGDEAELAVLLKSMDNTAATAQVRGGLLLAPPFGDGRFAVSIAARSRFAARFEYDSGDEERLRLTPLLVHTDLIELQSRVLASGVAVGAVGLTYARPLTDSGDTVLGATLKHQEILLYERDIPIKRYRESELFELDSHTDRRSQPNIDVGVYRRWGDWGASLTLRDLVQTTYRGPLGSRYRHRSMVEAGVALEREWGRIELDADITRAPGFGEMSGRRVVSLRSAFPLWRRFSGELGYRWVSVDRDDNAMTGAIRYQLLEGFHIRLEGVLAGRRELGGAFELQLLL